MGRYGFYGSLVSMKLNHATFTDALQIALTIEGGNDWRERLAQLVLPKGWSIAVAVDSTVIFDVGFVDPWVTAGVHHDLVLLGLRTSDMLTQKFILQDLANSVWRAYERAINVGTDAATRDSGWKQLQLLMAHVNKSKLHTQSEWAYLSPVVAKCQARFEGTDDCEDSEA